MSNDTVIVGNLGADPVLRTTQTGRMVASFSVSATPRRKDGDTWIDDGDPLWVRVTVWENVAEHVTNSLSKGNRVIVTGRLRLNKYTDKDGVERTSLEMTANEVGATLKFAAVKIEKVERATAASTSTGSADPWETAAPAQGDEPPF